MHTPASYDLPRFECLQKAAQQFPSLDPGACAVFLNLWKTGDAISEAGSEFLGRHGLTQARFMMLMTLSQCRDFPANPAGLAESCGVTRATITGVLDTLERDGLITREACPTDRRSIKVEMTAKGRSLIDTVAPKYFERVAEIVSPLDDAERSLLVALLQKIHFGLFTDTIPKPAIAP
ncbi:MAG TPA: MarR family transcriptional regulator [Chthoniobacterales bacterium]